MKKIRSLGAEPKQGRKRAPKKHAFEIVMPKEQVTAVMEGLDLLKDGLHQAEILATETKISRTTARMMVGSALLMLTFGPDDQVEIEGRKYSKAGVETAANHMISTAISDGLLEQIAVEKQLRKKKS